MGAIYKITCLENNKIYVGQTIVKYPKKRISQHKRRLNKNNHHNQYLQNCWNKYGENKFTFEFIEILNDIDLLNEKEKYYINKFNTLSPNGFNLMEGGYNSLHSEESKRMMSINSSGEKHPLYGKTWEDIHGEERSIELKENMSKIHRGKKLSECHLKKLSDKRHLYKKVLQFNKSGNLIREWEYLTQASNELDLLHSKISLVCSGDRNHCGGFVWRYKDSVNNIEEESKNIKEFWSNYRSPLTGKSNPMYGVKGDKHPRSKKVMRLSDNKIYNCLREASEDNNLGISSISNHCNEKYKTQKFKYI